MNGNNQTTPTSGVSGSLIGSIIIVIILILGAIYFLATRNDTTPPLNGEVPTSTSTGAPVNGEETIETLETEAQIMTQESAQLEAELNQLNQESGL